MRVGDQLSLDLVALFQTLFLSEEQYELLVRYFVSCAL